MKVGFGRLTAVGLVILGLGVGGPAEAEAGEAGVGLPAESDEPEARGADAEPLFVEVTDAVGLRGVHGERVSFADLTGNGYPDAIVGVTKVLLNEPADRAEEPSAGGRSGRGAGPREAPPPPGPGGRGVGPREAGAGGRVLRRSPRDGPLQAEGRRGYTSVQIGDVNGNGIADLFLGRTTDLSRESYEDDGLRSEVWLGDGAGGFTMFEGSGVSEHAETTIAACFVDYDNDGVLDLFVGNAYAAYGRSFEAFPDRLLRGNGDGTFTDVTEAAGLLGRPEPGRADSRRPTYGVTHTDWNNNGLQDLLTMSYGRQWNRLWRNDGDGTFTDVGPQTGFDGDAIRCGTYPEEIRQRLGRHDELPFRANGNTFDAAVADYNGNGYMDVFLAEITHWWAGPSSDPSMLLVNRGAAHGFAFERRPELITRPHTTEHWDQGDMHAAWIDVDNDGYLDLLIASSDYPDEQILRLYRQRPDGSGTFEDWTDRLGFRWVNASQIALGDFNRNGATDILLGTNHRRLSPEQRAQRDLSVGLFLNRAPALNGNGFLNLRLRGGGPGKANRDAVGARVTIWIDGRRQTREVQGGQGHAGHRDDTDCRFGIGKAERVDRIEVRWPDADGTVQRFEDVAANRFYVLEQGGALQDVGGAARPSGDQGPPGPDEAEGKEGTQ